uniref:uncharacterized protein LOC120336047 n=1 Tax=Styela clava TaxID=7725 RepID=UPI001939BFAD|nr:uncharacterized protein LOC120336047 [Styela clava]
MDCNLTRRKIDFFNQALESREYKLENLYLQDKNLEIREFYNLAKLASTTKPKLLGFKDSDLNFDKLDSFARGASENKLQLHTLTIMEEKSMEPEVFFKFAQVASVTNSEKICFHHCNLTNEKLDSFSQGALECGLKIPMQILPHQLLTSSQVLFRSQYLVSHFANWSIAFIKQ